MYLNFLWSFLKTQSQVKNQDVAKKPTVCRSTDDVMIMYIITCSEGWSGSGVNGWICRLSKLCWVTGSSSVGRASGVESSGARRSSIIDSTDSSDTDRSCIEVAQFCSSSSSSWTCEVGVVELFSTPLAYQLHQLIFNL